jgi:hypothetical protein
VKKYSYPFLLSFVHVGLVLLFFSALARWLQISCFFGEAALDVIGGLDGIA